MKYLILIMILVLAHVGMANADHVRGFKKQSRHVKHNFSRNHHFNHHHSGFIHGNFRGHHGTQSFPSFAKQKFIFIKSLPTIDTFPHHHGHW